MRSSIPLYAIMLVLAVAANQVLTGWEVPLGTRIAVCTSIGICVAIVYRWFERRARRRKVR